MSLNLRAGEIVADYEIVGVLGSGGMSTVYQVRHLISQRIEAMKTVLPNLEGNREIAERFMREIRVLASLSHPGIAVLHTAFRHQNQLLMVMEWVHGETMSSLLRRQGVSPARAIELTTQILSALGYAHTRGVVHRDVKPSNVMVTATGQAKLLDFGIARREEDTELTHQGDTIGSFHYMAPEQIRASHVDGRADLYSVGVTLYEMATGTRPFRGVDAYAVMRAHMEEIPPPPDSVNARVSRELSQIILKAMKKDPVERFQTAEEFAACLFALPAQMESGSEAVTLLQPSAATMATAERATTTSTLMPVTDPASLEQLSAKLAHFIGPVAKVLVRRAAKNAASWDELCRSLSTEIPEKERAAFLSSCQD